METHRKVVIESAILLVIVLCCAVDGARIRGSFGKRIAKPSGSTIKDTPEPEPEQSDVTEDEAGDVENMKCGSLDMKLNEKQVQHLKECAQKVGVASKKELTPEKFPCFAKCLFEHKALVDDKGMPHKENIVNMFSETMPDEVKETLKKKLIECLENHSALVEPSDETCATYTPLAMCVHMSYTEACKGM